MYFSRLVNDQHVVKLPARLGCAVVYNAQCSTHH
jgi:hypothetical protein